MEIKLIIGMAAGILTSVSSIPQIVKILKDKTAEAVSPFMFFVLLCGNGLWCYYGFLLDDVPIISTNALAVILDILMIVLNYKYSKHS
jgi:MtN3 and saliva related transmembrane protein